MNTLIDHCPACEHNRAALLESVKERDEACAQVAALRKLLSRSLESVRFAAVLHLVDEVNVALASTATVAAAHDERVRREALEEAAKEFDYEPPYKLNDSSDLNKRQRERVVTRLRALAAKGVKP